MNSTSQDTLQAALDFAAQQGLTFPILLDQQGAVSSSYRVQALPSTFFIRPDGVIQEVVVGGPMSEALLRTRVERLLSTLPVRSPDAADFTGRTLRTAATRLDPAGWLMAGG